MKKIILFTVILILFAISAMAQGPGPGLFDEELSLTAQQKEQMESMMIQHQKKMIPMKAELKLAKLELKEIMAKAKLDEKAALSQGDRVSAIKAEISRVQLQHKMAMRKILTEEQQAKMKELRKGHPGKRGFGAGRKGPGCCEGSGPMPGMGPMGPGKGLKHGMNDDD